MGGKRTHQRCRQEGRRLLVAVVIASQLLAASVSPALAAGRTRTAAVMSLDLVLREGTIGGRLIDHDGRPAAGKAVTLYRDGEVAAVQSTDAGGRFEFGEQVSGAASLTCGGGVLPCRLWPASTAPPHAVRDLVIRMPDPAEPPQQVIRGQSPGTLWNQSERPFWTRERQVIVIVAIAGAAIIGAVYSRPSSDAFTFPDFPTSP